jgi:hypothetical protein
MSLLQSFPVEDVVRRGSIRDAEIALLRAAFDGGAPVTERDADTLFALDEACPVQHAAWGGLFVDALTDHFVHQVAPDGYLNKAKAERLIGMISREGKTGRRTELDLLLGILETARWIPLGLARFALDQVKHAVATGEGPIRSASALPAGSISEAEVELIRRVLYAFGGNARLAITRGEAEVLLDINGLLAEPAPEAWADLFAKAIANLLAFASGHAVPLREEALAREPLGDTASRGASGVLLRAASSEERAIARLERQRIEIITNEAIAEVDAAWLSERLASAGAVNPGAESPLGELLAALPVIDAQFGELAVARQARPTAAE